MADIIELDSDDDMQVIGEDSVAGASINIVNSVPLDLNSLLGLGPPPPQRETNSYQSIARPPVSHRPLTATVRLSSNGYGPPVQRFQAPAGASIRSSTSVTYTTSFHPLPIVSQNRSQPPVDVPPRVTTILSRSTSPMATNPMMKMRLQLSQNGGYMRMPFTPTAPPMPRPVVEYAEEVTDERLHNYAFDAEREGEKNVMPDGIMNNFRFRCTYGACSKLIFGNVNFMNHLWAHIAIWKATEEGENDKGKTDIDKLSICPQCLARFENPFDMQVHYTRAHSRLEQAVSTNTCAICEKEHTSLKHHLAKHHAKDAPYRCSACSYKCNIRMHLYDHFCRRHAHGTILICPFCSFSVEVNTMRKRRHVIKAHEYVYHLRKHELVTDKRDVIRQMSVDGSPEVAFRFDPEETKTNNRRIACDKCAKCFTNQADRIDHAKTEHSPIKTTASSDQRRYIIRPRKVETRTRRKAELTLMMRGKHAMCGDCKKMPREQRPAQCALCSRLLFAIDAMASKNIAYSDYVVRNDIRSLAWAKIELGKCRCGFKSTNGNALASHFCSCRRTIRVQLYRNRVKTEKKEREPTKEEKKAENAELALFAIEKERAPENAEAQKLKMAELAAEVEVEIHRRIREYVPDEEEELLKPKKKSKKEEEFEVADCLAGMERRLEKHTLDLTGAMKFRVRITKNDFSASAKQYLEVMKRREE